MMELIYTTRTIPEYTKHTKDKKTIGEVYDFFSYPDAKDKKVLTKIYNNLVKDTDESTRERNLNNFLNNAYIDTVTLKLNAFCNVPFGSSHSMFVSMDSLEMRKEYREDVVSVQKCIGMGSPETSLYRLIV